MKIAQYHGISATSKAIRFLTRSNISHSAFVFDEQTEAVAEELLNAADNGFGYEDLPWRKPGAVIEAWSPVVRNVESISEQHEPFTQVDLYNLKYPLSVKEERVLLLCLIPVLGTKYNWRDVFRFITRWPGKLDGSWFCSELVFAMLQKAQRTLFERTDAWEVPPGWIHRSKELLPYMTLWTTA